MLTCKMEQVSVSYICEHEACDMAHLHENEILGICIIEITFSASCKNQFLQVENELCR